MSHWSKLTVETARELQDLIKQARQDVGRAPDGVGVFRAREGLVLYFSPIATASLVPALGLSVEACARPDDMSVQVVVGPSDEPAWYDWSATPMTAEPRVELATASAA